MRGGAPRSDRVGGPEPSGTDPAALLNDTDPGLAPLAHASQRLRPVNRYAKRSELHRNGSSTFYGQSRGGCFSSRWRIGELCEGAALREASGSEPGCCAGAVRRFS